MLFLLKKKCSWLWKVTVTGPVSHPHSSLGLLMMHAKSECIFLYFFIAYICLKNAV